MSNMIKEVKRTSRVFSLFGWMRKICYVFNEDVPERKPRLIRVAVASNYFLSGFTFATWASRIPTIQDKLHLSNAELGGALFALPLGLVMTLPFTSFILRRFDSRYPLIVGSCFFNLLLCVLGNISDPRLFFLILFLFGCARNLMNISLNTQSVGVQSLYKKSVLTSFHAVWSISGAGAAAIGAYMSSRGVSLSVHFICAAVITTPFVLITFRNTFRGDAPVCKQRVNKLFLVPHGSLLILGIIAFCCMAIEGAMYDWSGVYFHKVVRAANNGGFGYVSFMAAMTTGRIFGDRLVSKFGIKQILQISGILIAGGLALAIALPSLSFALAGFAMTGFGVSCIMPLLLRLAGETSTIGNGPAIAAVSTVSYFGFLAVPPIIGQLAEVMNLKWAFALISMLGVAVFILISITWNSLKRRNI
jgi:MFS family permease